MNRKGFLLADLMVAIGIFGLVFVLAIPSFELIRDYQHKQFLSRLERLLKSAENLSILKKTAHAIDLSQIETQILLLEQRSSEQNYYEFAPVKNRALKVPGSIQVRFFRLQAQKRVQISNRLLFYAGGRLEDFYIEVQRNGKIKNYKMHARDPLKEVEL